LDFIPVFGSYGIAVKFFQELHDKYKKGIRR